MSTVRTAVVRLAAPLQSWGEVSRFTRRGTLPYPTYSALCGLLRCAAGVDRDDPGHDLLDGLAMAVRVDRTGGQLVDYHSVNPKHPRDYREVRTVGRGGPDPLATVVKDDGRPWEIRGELQTLLTHRTYLTDAVFLWLIAGEEEQLERAYAALRDPVWGVFLGRKTCVPNWPYLLGTYDGPAMAAARAVPRVAPESAPAAVECHLLNPELVEERDGMRPVAREHADGIGSAGGYVLRTREIELVNVPKVATRDQLLDWTKRSLRL